MTAKERKKKPRKQCAKCPWKADANPHDIPNEYCPTKHAKLKNTIAEPGDLKGAFGGEIRIMACHETGGGPRRPSLPCVGWMLNQLGPGNNIALRLLVMFKKIDANVEAVGPQHERFEDTLPDDDEG